MPPKAKWTAGKPAAVVDKDGVLAASVPVKDGGKLVATVTFTLTAERGLRVEVVNEPGAAGFTDFQAWMRKATS